MGGLEVQQGGALSILFSHLLRPHLASPDLDLPVSRPWQSPRVGCKGQRTDGYSCLPPTGVDSRLHDLAAGCIPWGGIPGLSRAAVTACSWGGSSEGSQGEQLLLLPGSWLCTWVSEAPAESQ